MTEAAKRNLETVSYQLLDTYDIDSIVPVAILSMLMITPQIIASHGSSEYQSDALTIKPLGPLAESRRQAT